MMDDVEFERGLRRRKQLLRGLWVVLGLAPIVALGVCMGTARDREPHGEPRAATLASVGVRSDPEVAPAAKAVSGAPDLERLAAIPLYDAPPCPVALPAQFPLRVGGRELGGTGPQVVYLTVSREEPNLVEGRAILWDVARSAAICAADVRVTANGAQALASELATAIRTRMRALP